MTEAKTLREFRCNKCGGKETVTGLAVKELIDRGILPPGTHYALRREIKKLIPIEQATFTLPVMIIDWDICAGCGNYYPTKVETMDAPITMKEIKGDHGSDLPPGFGRG